MNALATDELDKLMRSHPLTKQAYIGAFPCDARIDSPTWRPFSIIFNIDQSFLPGSHWTAVFVDGVNVQRPEYFDSTGLPPTGHIREWLSQFGSPFVSSSRRVQPVSSDLCGYYCLYFIHQRSIGKSWRSIMASFSRDLCANDRMIRRWFSKSWMT